MGNANTMNLQQDAINTRAQLEAAILRNTDCFAGQDCKSAYLQRKALLGPLQTELDTCTASRNACLLRLPNECQGPDMRYNAVTQTCENYLSLSNLDVCQQITNSYPSKCGAENPFDAALGRCRVTDAVIAQVEDTGALARCEATTAGMEGTRDGLRVTWLEKSAESKDCQNKVDASINSCDPVDAPYNPYTGRCVAAVPRATLQACETTLQQATNCPYGSRLLNGKCAPFHEDPTTLLGCQDALFPLAYGPFITVKTIVNQPVTVANTEMTYTVRFRAFPENPNMLLKAAQFVLFFPADFNNTYTGTGRFRRILNNDLLNPNVAAWDPRTTDLSYFNETERMYYSFPEETLIRSGDCFLLEFTVSQPNRLALYGTAASEPNVAYTLGNTLIAPAQERGLVWGLQGRNFGETAGGQLTLCETKRTECQNVTLPKTQGQVTACNNNAVTAQGMCSQFLAFELPLSLSSRIGVLTTTNNGQGFLISKPLTPSYMAAARTEWVVQEPDDHNTTRWYFLNNNYPAVTVSNIGQVLDGQQGVWTYLRMTLVIGFTYPISEFNFYGSSKFIFSFFADRTNPAGTNVCTITVQSSANALNQPNGDNPIYVSGSSPVASFPVTSAGFSLKSMQHGKLVFNFGFYGDYVWFRLRRLNHITQPSSPTTYAYLMKIMPLSSRSFFATGGMTLQMAAQYVATDVALEQSGDMNAGMS